MKLNSQQITALANDLARKIIKIKEDKLKENLKDPNYLQYLNDIKMFNKQIDDLDKRKNLFKERFLKANKHIRFRSFSNDQIEVEMGYHDKNNLPSDIRNKIILKSIDCASLDDITKQIIKEFI